MRHGLVQVVAVAFVVGGCGSGTPRLSDVDDARTELLGYVWDITSADGY